MAKPRKVEEPAGTYLTSPKSGEKAAAVRHARSEDVKKVNAQLMQIHRKVLQKLAQ